MNIKEIIKELNKVGEHYQLDAKSHSEDMRDLGLLELRGHGVRTYYRPGAALLPKLSIQVSGMDSALDWQKEFPDDILQLVMGVVCCDFIKEAE